MFRNGPVIVLLCATIISLPALAQAAAATRPTVIEDPHYGEVLFHFYQDDFFPAIVRLLAARETSRLTHHDAEAEILLGGLQLSYGQHQRAAEIFERLLRDSTDPSIRDRTWFFLARIWLQRGYVDAAHGALTNIENALPESLAAEARLLLTHVLIRQRNYRAAIDHLREFRDPTEWGSYSRYNLGVALAREGETTTAEKILDELGRLDPYNAELAALRDKANLALGYAYLQDGRAEDAMTPLRRVRLEGPFSNKALLGFGWAEAGLGRFADALVPWSELLARDLLDPAVQESMLAVPYAMAKIDASRRAETHYLDAIEAFKREDERIRQAIDTLEQGEFLHDLLAANSTNSSGWSWRLDTIPQGTTSRYLYHLLASHEFQESLKNFRDLDFLLRNLRHWHRSVDVFHTMLESRERAYRERLPAVQRQLAESDPYSMEEGKQALTARLNRVEHDRDALALATKGEQLLWHEVTILELHAVLDADLPEARAVRSKVRLLKGVLQWQFERDFKERLWRARQDVASVGDALLQTSRSRQNIDESMRAAPRTFEAFRQRIVALRPRIRDLDARVSQALEQQRKFLHGIAADELRAKQERLRAYSVQARFALAAIYDLAATTEAAQ